MSDITDRERSPAAEIDDPPQFERNPFQILTPLVLGGVIARCQRCGCVLDLGFRIYGGLGPSLIECPGCKAVTLSHRHEWADMSWSARLRFLALSFYYVLFGSLSGFLLAVLAYEWGGFRYQMQLILPLVWALVWAAVVVGLQGFRLVRSLYRTGQDPRQPCRPSWLNPDFGLQWKFIVLEVSASILLAGWLQLSRFLYGAG